MVPYLWLVSWKQQKLPPKNLQRKVASRCWGISIVNNNSSTLKNIHASWLCPCFPVADWNWGHPSHCIRRCWGQERTHARLGCGGQWKAQQCTRLWLMLNLNEIVTGFGWCWIQIKCVNPCVLFWMETKLNSAPKHPRILGLDPVQSCITPWKESEIESTKTVSEKHCGWWTWTYSQTSKNLGSEPVQCCLTPWKESKFEKTKTVSEQQQAAVCLNSLLIRYWLMSLTQAFYCYYTYWYAGCDSDTIQRLGHTFNDMEKCIHTSLKHAEDIQNNCVWENGIYIWTEEYVL